MKNEYWIAVLSSVCFLLERYLWEDERILALRHGDQVIMSSPTDEYDPDEGWIDVEVICEFIRLEYPSIVTGKGRFHYTRFVSRTSKQLKLF